jgi:hypothetical protein
MKKLLVIAFLLPCFKKAKAQELLNANENQIKTYMEKRGGVFKIKKDFKGDAHHTALSVIYYDWSKFTSMPEDLYDVSFFMSKNKCYKYMIRYNSDRLLSNIIDSVSNKDADISKAEKNLKWVNSKKDYQVEIVKDSDVDKDAHSTGFLLIYKTGAGTSD